MHVLLLLESDLCGQSRLTLAPKVSPITNNIMKLSIHQVKIDFNCGQLVQCT